MRSPLKMSIDSPLLTRALLLMVALLLMAPLAQAQKFYKWQDENGTWHYDSKPPKDQQAQPLNVRAKSATPTEGEAVAKAEAEKAEVTKELAGDNSANCKRAQDNLRILLNNAQVKKDVDGDGAEEVLSSDEHLAEVSATRKQVEKFCGK